MKKILLSEPISDKGLSLLKEKADVVMARGITEDDIIADIKDIYGIVLKSRAKITRRILEAAPGLKIISRTGVGYDNVDVRAATDHNVLVCNLPGINAVSVAEQTMSFILALAKRIPAMDKFTRTGMWSKRSELLSAEIKGKTLGIIGLGQIGCKVMKMAQAFEMNTLAFDPYVKDKFSGQTAFAASLEELFSASDFITIHVPSLPETKNMINKGLLNRMKRTASLINTSRGEVLDEKALIQMLKDNQIMGAALDVFEKEPLVNEHPFISMDNVILSPHIAALTKECGEKMTISAVNQIIDYLEGGLPPFIVNRNELYLKGRI